MYNCYIALFSYNLNFTESSVKAQNLLRINTKKKNLRLNIPASVFLSQRFQLVSKWVSII